MGKDRKDLILFLKENLQIGNRTSAGQTSQGIHTIYRKVFQSTRVKSRFYISTNVNITTKKLHRCGHLCI